MRPTRRGRRWHDEQTDGPFCQGVPYTMDDSGILYKRQVFCRRNPFGPSTSPATSTTRSLTASPRPTQYAPRSQGRRAGPVTGTRGSAAASSWELGISAQRAARRTLWLVSSACRRCDDTEGANNAGLTEINQASTWFTGLKVETHSELRKPLVGLTGFEPATT